ncbi:MAG: DUF2934 domain-containing protein [Acidobacteria bacterium]|nr:DUF2934 domain-containing protein [Acidobacteriota bacterium]
MPTPFVQLIPSSDPAGLPLAGTISQAIETIRRRAFEIFEQKSPQEGSEFHDWLRAERELFEIPEAAIVEAGDSLTARFDVEPSSTHPLTILVEPQAVTAVSFNEQGELKLLRRLDLSDPVDPLRVSIQQSGAAVEVMLTRAHAPLRAAAAAAGGGGQKTGLITAA